MPARIHLSVEQEEQIRSLYARGRGSTAIAKIMDTNAPLISSNLKRMGVPIRSRSEAAALAHRARGHGNRKLDGNGYVLVKITADDPFFGMAFASRGAAHTRWVFEHRLVMARNLGRSLTRRETVHHKNGIRQDNRIENLQLRVGRHGSGQVAACRTCGSRDIAFEEIGAPA